MATANIRIKNTSGHPQTYALYTDPPTITSPSAQPTPHSTVFNTATSLPNYGSATFTIWTKYHAICGTATDGYLSIASTKPVTLGSGSAVALVCRDGRPPSLGVGKDGEGEEGSWRLETGDDFSAKDAAGSNLVVGMAMGPDAASAGPIGCFVPEPGCQYQIQPGKVFYLAFGEDFEIGKLVNVEEMKSRAIAIDFTKVSDYVNVVHGEDGTLSIQ